MVCGGSSQHCHFWKIDENISLCCWLYVCTMLYPIYSNLIFIVFPCFSHHLRLLYLQHPWFKLWNLRRHLKHGFGRLFSQNFSPPKNKSPNFGVSSFRDGFGSILDWPQIRPQILRCLRPSPAAGDANASAQVWETVSETVADLKNPKRSEFSRGNHGKLWETIRSSCFFWFDFPDVQCLQLSD